MALATFGVAAFSTQTAHAAGASPSPSSSAAPAKDAPARATFGIAPVTLGKTDARGYFSYDMGVGGTYSDKVAVLNYGPTPLALDVYAADLSNADDGSIVVGQPDATFTDAGGWIKLPQAQQVITVPATNAKTGVGRVVLPFRVVVPNDAAPGDHGAALIAVLSTLGKNAKGENVRLNQRIASRIYLRVAGPLHPSMRIEDLKVTYAGKTNPIGAGRATVSFVVHNTGNVRLGATQRVSISGLFGKAKTVVPAEVPLLFPGAEQPVTVKISGVLPTIFEHARVTVTPTLFKDQSPEPVPVAKATASFHAVPWTLLAVLAAVVILAALVLLWRRRNRRRPAPPSGGHKKPRGPRSPDGPLGAADLVSPRSPETIQR